MADLKSRAQIIHAIRCFFIEQQFLEVETPSMGHYAVTDCYLKNIEVAYNHATHYLQTSPEYYMKRLLAAGSGSIFQIGKSFRDEENGRWHQPEFTMLEFYQLDVNHLQLIALINDLFTSVCQWPDIETVSYEALFEEYCGINPHHTHVTELQNCLSRFGLTNILTTGETDLDQYLFLLMAEVIELKLADRHNPIAVIDFPSSQSALAKIANGKAERFEIYYQGIELANGFHELTNPDEQLSRFEQDNQNRIQQGKLPITIDPCFLAALQSGLPSCSGVAIGIDRLVALCLGRSGIQSVMSFAQT